MNERFPSNSIVRMLSGIRAVEDPALAADVDAFTPSTRSRRRSRPSQHLERMKVSVALRARAALRDRTISDQAEHEPHLGEVVGDHDRHAAVAGLADEAVPGDQRVADVEEAGADDGGRRCPRRWRWRPWPRSRTCRRRPDRPARVGSGPHAAEDRGAEDREHGHHEDDPDEEARRRRRPSTCSPTM